jgi:nucleotide-binding universal stress UspA family protein
VPLDASAFSESALPLALTLAGRTGAEIRLAMVNEPVDTPGFWTEAFLDNHAEYLDGVTTAVRRRAPVTSEVSSALLEGPVASSLLAEADASGADLVVMGTPGRGGVAGMWLGSVAEAIVRQSALPVTLVRAEESGARGLDAPTNVSHVVVPLDGSAFGEAAITPALEVCRTLSDRLTFLFTIAHPVLGLALLPDAAELNRAFIERAEADARTYLCPLRERYAGTGVGIHVDVMTGVRPFSGTPRRMRSTWWRWRRMHAMAYLVRSSVAWRTRSSEDRKARSW